MSARDKLKTLFEIYLADPEDYDWKEIILDLYDLAYEDHTLFSNDALHGLSYMCEVVHHQVCKKCGDNKGFVWLKEYATKWLAGSDNLPLWPASCMFSEEDVT